MDEVMRNVVPPFALLAMLGVAWWIPVFFATEAFTRRSRMLELGAALAPPGYGVLVMLLKFVANATVGYHGFHFVLGPGDRIVLFNFAFLTPTLFVLVAWPVLRMKARLEQRRAEH
jgi:hypothetical protein